MDTINLELSLDEANIVLEGLGQLPFVKVYALIAKIQAQARAQLNGGEARPDGDETAPSAPRVTD